MRSRNERLDEVAAIAVVQERLTGVPARCMVAQWAVESKWGSKPVGNANYFGIKRAKRHKRYCAVTTHEYVDGVKIECVQEFADYDSLAESCADYAWLISRGAPYRTAWQKFDKSGNVTELINGIARVYATSPGYASLVLKIAYQDNVASAIESARNRAHNP